MATLALNVPAAAANFTYETEWSAPDGGVLGAFATDPNGDVYVFDTSQTSAGSFKTALDKFSPAGALLWQRPFAIGGVAVTAAGTVLLAGGTGASGPSRIFELSPTGQQIGSLPLPQDGYDWSGPITVGPSGDIYVEDTSNDEIARLSAAGRYLGRWGGQGNGAGKFSGMGGLASDPAGRIFVADSGNNQRIQIFTRTGQFVGSWGKPYDSSLLVCSQPGTLYGPYDVAIDSSGDVYETDFGGGQVQEFTASGGFIAAYGNSCNSSTDPATTPGEFVNPSWIALDCFGDAYVEDDAGGRIQKFGVMPPRACPSPSPPSSSPPPPPVVSVPGGQSLGGVLSRGLAIALGCTRLPCTAQVALRVGQAQLHAGDGRARRTALVVVGRARFVITRRGRRVVRVRLFAGPRRHFRGLRQLHLTVVVTATSSGHTSRPAVRHVVLRR